MVSRICERSSSGDRESFDLSWISSVCSIEVARDVVIIPSVPLRVSIQSLNDDGGSSLLSAKEMSAPSSRKA